jgi:hypothetical protein
MKKAANLVLSAMVLAVFVSVFSSCGDDDEKKVAEVSFDFSVQTVDEDEDEIFIPYVIENGPVPDDAEISFNFSGTATVDEDYEFLGWDEDGVYITLFNDFSFESDETIIISMTNGEEINIGQPDTHTVTIEDDDVDTGTNLKIDLTWDAGSGTPGDVDMDLILWQYDPIAEEFNVIAASDEVETVFESLTLSSSEADGIYGFTYLYFEGSSDNLEFTVTFTTTDGSINGTENELAFSETYTQDNLFNGETVFIEQELEKDGTDYSNFTTIDVPEEGSRAKSFKLPSLKQKKNSITRSITVKKINK